MDGVWAWCPHPVGFLARSVGLVGRRPTSLAFTATGDPGELAAHAANWFETILRRQIVRYEWTHNGQPYAHTYLFADMGDMLVALLVIDRPQRVHYVPCRRFQDILIVAVDDPEDLGHLAHQLAPCRTEVGLGLIVDRHGLRGGRGRFGRAGRQSRRWRPQRDAASRPQVRRGRRRG
ncbi:MAG: hypothetical protein M3443_20745 [Actinomycetota bacterium]|nr:hypothetical protein [Actinomycetota bacterium]